MTSDGASGADKQQNGPFTGGHGQWPTPHIVPAVSGGLPAPEGRLPGWYSAPGGVNVYWDGEAWIDSYQARQVGAAGLTPVVVRHEKAFNHLPHIILTVLTVGIWAPVWAVTYWLHRANPMNQSRVEYH